MMVSNNDNIILKILLFLYYLQLIQCQLFTEFNLPKLKSQQQIDQDTIIKIKQKFDNPLILTPYIEAGQYKLARKLSKVNKELFLNVTSYSGYLTVDNIHNGNLFFWFFPAEGTEYLYKDDDVDNFGDYYDGEDENTDYDHIFLKKLSKRPKPLSHYSYNDGVNRKEFPKDLNANKPIVLWLQGGPGASSLFGLFTENGPFFINENDSRSIKENPYSWHKNYSILFIDNSVGTGFSFTDSENGYVKNMTQVGIHMYKALRQFFDLFSFLKMNDFFITGESFAGKYIPAIANEIYEQNIANKYEKDKLINLKGLALGNAFSDPYNMHDYADFAYQLGLVGSLGYQEMKIYEYLVKANFDNPIKAKQYWDGILDAFARHSYYNNFYNIQEPSGSVDLLIFFDFINQPKIRNALHVGAQKFHDSSKVYENLIPDFMSTAIHWIEKLLNNDLRVFYYNGNWDLIVAYPLSENSFNKMKWNYSNEYLYYSERKPIYVNGKLKGYIKKAKNFIEGTFLNAGHMVPTDQPIACLSVIDAFFKNKL